MRDRDQKPDATEYGELRAWLASKGLTTTRINAAVGSRHADAKSRQDMAADLIAELRKSPKAR